MRAACSLLGENEAMCRYIISPLVVLLSLTSNAAALFIAHDGSTSPFSLRYQDAQLPLAFILQVANESVSTPNVMSWQLINLELRPLATAQGNLKFQDAGSPPDSLFGQTPGPQSNLSGPSSTISVFDSDPNFVGEPVAPHSSRNILKLTVQASPATTGEFQIIIPQVQDPEADSSWFDADEFTAKAFENSATSAFSNMILLGTINVGKEPSFSPGDYNRDGQIDGADYDRWRSDFGILVSTPGEGADGNRDLLVDAADYVVWRKSAPTGSFNASAAVPEPTSVFLLTSALVIWSGLGRAIFLVPRKAKRQK
jgi:hypothetical protein